MSRSAASVSRVLAETNTALGTKKKDILELEARLNTARSLVDEKEQAITSLNSEITTLRSAQKSSKEGAYVRIPSPCGEEYRIQWTAAGSCQPADQVEEKEQAITSLNSEINARSGPPKSPQKRSLTSVSRLLAEKNTAFDGQQQDLVSLQTKLEEKEQAIKTLYEEIAKVSLARESAEQELASVSRVLAETNTSLGSKEKEILDLETRLNTASSLVEEEQRAITSLSSEIATLRSAQKSSEQESGIRIPSPCREEYST